MALAWRTPCVEEAAGAGLGDAASTRGRRAAHPAPTRASRPAFGDEAISRTEFRAGVYVYFAQHVLENCTASAFSSLTVADHREFERIRHPGARSRSLMTRAVLRRALSEAAGTVLAPRQWTFKRGGKGKPHLDASHPPLEFSCSHADGLSVVAVSSVGPVGIDIVNLSAPIDLSIADLFLSAREARWLRDHSGSELGRWQGFCKLWALKEACLKMNGDALSERIKETEFDPVTGQLKSTPEATAAYRQAEFTSWHTSALGRDYAVAIAIGPD